MGLVLSVPVLFDPLDPEQAVSASATTSAAAAAPAVGLNFNLAILAILIST
ncbi:hypothetical protein [Asanoa sp. NPDC050611]|uniref:hypothetical protein n=1 Tax=Asanoa sp. NPDC050611 TaxID=3157098 RepID=UPI0033EC980D